MMSISEKFKNEANDIFENFIVQVICPSNDEVNAVVEHNRSVKLKCQYLRTVVNCFFFFFHSTLNSCIINDFRQSFFSIYNHFMVLSAEMMEKFLICNYCTVPIGFPHQPLCVAKSTTSNIWRKTKIDDKFITYGMNFCFNDLVVPGCRKNIMMQITNSCGKQKSLHQQQKCAMPLLTRAWPSRWLRSSDNRSVNRNQNQRSRITYPVQIAHPIYNPSGKSSIWTSTHADQLKMSNYEIIGHEKLIHSNLCP